jgi:hypothetical protein
VRGESHRIDSADEEDGTDDLGSLETIRAHFRSEDERDQHGRPEHGEVMLQSKEEGGERGRNLRDRVGDAIVLGLLLVRYGGGGRVFAGFGGRIFVGSGGHLFARHLDLFCEDPLSVAAQVGDACLCLNMVWYYLTLRGNTRYLPS